MAAPLKNVVYVTVLGDYLGTYKALTSQGQEFENPYTGCIKTVPPKFIVEREQTERPRILRYYNVCIQDEEFMLEFEGRSVPPNSTVICYHFKHYGAISSNDCSVLQWVA